MEVKIMIRQGWKLLIGIFFLAITLLAALLFSMQYILDGISMDYTLETYASVGTIYQYGSENAVYSPIQEDAIALLREADTVENVDIRRTISARIPETESVPCYFATTQSNHLVFLRGSVKDYMDAPAENDSSYDAGFATVEVKSVYAGKSNWITPGQNVYVGIVRSEGYDCRVEEDKEYYFITQSAFASQMGWLEDMVYAYNYGNDVIAGNEILQENSKLYQNTVIPVPEEMTGEAVDAYAVELLKERGLDAYTDEIRNLDDAFTVRETKDMQMLIPVANETMFFTAGRGIRPEDAGQKVCVVSQEFARLHNLQVGDCVALAMGDGCYEKNGYESGYPSLGEFSTVQYGEPQDYEIVGTYAFVTYDPAEATLLFSYNDIFIPTNENIDATTKTVCPYAFSFRVSGERIDEFMETTAMELRDMGYVVHMSSSRWEKVESTYNAMLQRRTSTLVWALLVFLFGTLVYVLLLMLLYRREYALRNLFGGKFSHTSRAYLIPFVVSSIFSGILSVAAADWLYVKKLMPQAELTAPGRIPENTQILFVLAALTFVWIMFVFIAILIAAKRSEKKSVVKLLK